VTGTDVVLVADGRIRALHTVLDERPDLSGDATV
jgi:hypothetical protein